MAHLKLPNYEDAVIDIRKLRDYALNPSHPEGRHKAKVFMSALGVTGADSQWLASAILQSLPDGEAVQTDSTPWGRLYRVDLPIVRGGRCAVVRTGWLCSGFTTKLTTCFVVGDCNETA
jgi:hypothetical protein